MMNSQSDLRSLSSSELLARTRELVETSSCVEAELLVHLGEIDERKLYAEFAFPSMFAFCVGELRFSEGAAYNWIMVARAGRLFPAVVEAMRSGQVHLGGLRLLAPHLTAENHREVLAQAAGKTKREIEELVARLAPQPAVAPMVRKVPEQSPRTLAEPLARSPFSASHAAEAPRLPARRGAAHGGDVQGPVHREPRTSRQAASSAGPAQAPGSRRRPGLHLRSGTRPAHRPGQEGALRDRSQAAAAAEGSCARTLVAPHPRRNQADRLRARRRTVHVHG